MRGVYGVNGRVQTWARPVRDCPQYPSQRSSSRRVLTGVAALTNSSEETLTALLRATASIGSDHETAVLLMYVAGRPAIQGDLRAVYLDAVARIGSDHEKNRALTALVDSRQ
jgi:hypothetical protein